MKTHLLKIWPLYRAVRELFALLNIYTLFQDKQ